MAFITLLIQVMHCWPAVSVACLFALQALVLCGRAGLVHADVKPDNVLVDYRFICMLACAFFRLSRLVLTPFHFYCTCPGPFICLALIPCGVRTATSFIIRNFFFFFCSEGGATVGRVMLIDFGSCYLARAPTTSSSVTPEYVFSLLVTNIRLGSPILPFRICSRCVA